MRNAQLTITPDLEANLPIRNEILFYMQRTPSVHN